MFHPAKLLSPLGVVAAIAALLAGVPAGSIAAPPPPRKPVNLVIAVDVSTSMFAPSKDNVAANDKGGIRWDGVQFLIDTADDEDRVALVIYRADAALVTRRLDPTGFVRLGNDGGRQKLKEMVRGFQVHEQNPANWDKPYPVPGAGKENKGFQFDVGGGTGSLPTLRAIQEWKLLGSGEQRQTWVMLFTDGMDTEPAGVEKRPPTDKPTDDFIVWGQDRFKYIKPLQKEYDSEKRTPAAPSALVLDALKQEIRDVVRPYQAAKVPVFTFGLYNPDKEHGTSPYELSVMRQILPEIARLSLEGVAADIRFARIPAGYEASNNLILLNKLQDVGWELRELWQIRETTGRDGGRGPFRFTTPDRRLCDDLGVLLYREVTGENFAGARAPDSTTAPGEVLRSASHHYVRIQPTAATGSVDVEALFPAGGDAHAVFGARLKAPILSYRLPDPNGRYTPIDAIPIEVGFDAAGDASLQPQMFEARATITRPGQTGAAKRIGLTLDRTKEAKGGWTFSGELIPDEFRKPDSGARPELMGLWSIDVEVKATQSGPLRGATRRLLRRQVNVGPYPKVLRPAVAPEVSNKSKPPARGTADFTLDPKPRSSKDRILASLSAELHPTNDPAWKGLKLPAIDRVNAKDGIAPIPLDLSTGFDWSAVPKEGIRARLVVRAPWAAKDDPPAECDVVIRKERYKVEAPGELVFDLSGAAEKDAPPIVDVVRATLVTDLATEEMVRVSGTDGANPTAEFKLTSDTDTTKTITIKLAASAPVKVPGAGGGDIRVAVERPTQKLAAGQYSGKLFLLPASNATELVEVKVHVRVNQPLVKEDGKPVPRVRMVALAGTSVTRQIEVALQENIKDQKIANVAPPRVEAAPSLRPSPDPTDPANRLPVRAVRLEDNRAKTRFTLTADVPSSVKDGVYAAEVQFDLTAETKKGENEKPEERKFKFPFPVEVEVRRFAVRAEVAREEGGKPLAVPEPGLPRRLIPAKDPAVDEAGLPLELFTEVKGAAVRWWAEIVPDDTAGPKGPKLPTLPGKPKPPDEWFKLRVDVIDDGKEPQSVLGKTARPLPVSEHISEPAGRKLRFVARKLGELRPGLYSCKVRFWGELDPADPKSKGAIDPKPVPFDLRIEVLVRGREIATQQLDGGKLEVKVTTFGATAGSGQLRSREDPSLRVPIVPTEAKAASESRGEETMPPVALTPTAGGLTKFVVYWPRRPNVETLPDAPTFNSNDVREREVAVWKRPEFELSHRVAAAGDRVTVQIPVTPTTIAMIGGKPIIAQVKRRGSAGEAPIDVALTPDQTGRLTGSFAMPTGTPIPPAGEYEITAPPLPVPESPAVEPKDRAPAPAIVLLGLELRKAERSFGPLVYGGGFFSTDSVSDPSVVRITNHTAAPVRYEVRILYPKNQFESQSITTQNLIDLPLAPFDPAQHLDIKPLVGDGTLAPGQAADIGVEVALSSDALDAYMNGRDHPTFPAKNGAVVVLTVSGRGPDNQEFKWEMRHPLIVETQSWRNRGLLYALVGAIVVGGVGWYGYRRWRRWVAKSRARSASPPDEGPFGKDEPPPPKLASPPDDDLPGGGNLFGGPPA